MRRNQKLYGKLFRSTFVISAFTFGGGYTIIPMLKKKFVDELGWIPEEEMLNLTALAQSSPGAVAVNGAMLVGHHIAGLPGALIAVAGTVLPPLLIISIISFFYVAFKSNVVVRAVLRGMQAGVVAVIADTVFSLGGSLIRAQGVWSLGIMLVAFAASFVFGVNLVFIILACAVLGAAMALVKQRREKRAGG